MKRNSFQFLILLACMLLACMDSLQAHSRSESFSYWKVVDDGVHMKFTARIKDVSKLALLERETTSLEKFFLDSIDKQVVVTSAGKKCVRQDSREILRSSEHYLRMTGFFRCPTDTDIDINIDIFVDRIASHIHFAQVETSGINISSLIFSNEKRNHSLALNAQSKDNSLTTLLDYMSLGIRHILTGVDHLVFLLALLLLCHRFRELVLLISGFTIGHCLSLALAATGTVQADVTIIESLIGFTIAIAAIEKLSLTQGSFVISRWLVTLVLLLLCLLKLILDLGLPILTLTGLSIFSWCYLQRDTDDNRSALWHPLISLVFGLIHGFGFARILIELDLPRNQLLTSLLGFNLGIELGQLFVIALLLIVIRSFIGMMKDDSRQLGLELLSACLCGIGIFWFIERSTVI